MHLRPLAPRDEAEHEVVRVLIFCFGRAREHGLLVRGQRGLDVVGVRGDGLAEFGSVQHILGVAGQNAANARALASSKMDRSAFLAAVAAQWAQLDPARYPSMHQAGTQLREHDDREQFLAGIDLILAGIDTVNGAGKDSPSRGVSAQADTARHGEIRGPGPD